MVNLLGLLGLALAARWYLEAKQRALEERINDVIREWAEPGPNNTPSKVAEVLDSAGVIVGNSLARTIMASLRTDSSHVARQANNAADLVQAQQNPILGLLAGGRRGKGAAVARLAELLMPMLTRASNGGHSDSKPTQGGFNLPS